MSSAPGHNAAALRARAEPLADALPALILSAERLAAVVNPGAHGLRRAGAGEDFWQYRPAHAGDAMRNIDWRRSARSDATFVRDREWQSAQSALIWVADGRAMDFGSGSVTKRDRAQLLALSLAMILLRSGEKVGAGGLRPRPGRAQIEPLAQALTLPGSAGDDAAPPTDGLRPGMRAVLISDFLGDPAPVEAFLARAADLGVRGAMLQVLDPDEENFPFSGAVLFQSMTGGTRFESRDAGGLRAGYLERLAERRALLSQASDRAGWQFGTHDTAAAPATALLWLYGALSGAVRGAR